MPLLIIDVHKIYDMALSLENALRDCHLIGFCLVNGIYQIVERFEWSEKIRLALFDARLAHTEWIQRMLFINLALVMNSFGAETKRNRFFCLWKWIVVDEVTAKELTTDTARDKGSFKSI